MKEKKELFEQIQESLHQHEEAYKPGAWENFKKFEQAKSKKVVPLWRWSAVAAAVLVSLSVLLFVTKKPAVESIQDGLNSTITQINPAEGKNQNTVDKPNLPNLSLQEKDVLQAAKKLNLASNNAPEVAIVDQQALQVAPQVIIEEQQVASIAPQGIGAVQQGIAAEIQILSLENQSAKLATEDVVKQQEEVSTLVSSNSEVAVIEKKSKPKLKALNSNRWTMGLLLAPSVSQNANDINMGYGLSVNYNLSPKLSLSSGIAYNKMNASKNLPSNLGASSVVLGNNKKLAVISEEVSGVDIPFELKYQFSPKVYANFGFSGFAVINQKRSNTFIQDVVITRPGTNISTNNGSSQAASGSGNIMFSDPSGPQGQFANSYIVRQTTTENVSSQAIDQINFLGFYNFSVGYTRRIYKQNTLAIEPFFKLPIREVTQDNLRMVGTGVRIKVGF